LFCVMVHAFGPNWAVVGPQLESAGINRREGVSKEGWRIQ
jgi:hypothetical protein